MLSNIERTSEWVDWQVVEDFKSLVSEKILHVDMSNDELNLFQDGCDFLDNMIESAREDKLAK